jgi:hypothetical protein
METMKINNINIQQSTPYTQDQNGVSKCSEGGDNSNGPHDDYQRKIAQKFMAGSVQNAAHNLLNQTPKRSLNWLGSRDMRCICMLPAIKFWAISR